MCDAERGCGCRTSVRQRGVRRGKDGGRNADDIDGFKKRLEEKGVRYADYGNWAMNGWYQIFFQDPEGNVIEVHQVSG